VRAIAFDKTGTLTVGRPQVVAVHALNGERDRLLALAAAVEERSEHPLARAVVHAGRALRNGSARVEATQFTALPGLGAHAEVDGKTVYVGSSRLFEERGLVLDGIGGTVEKLSSEGYTVMLVGTAQGVLGAIALADSPRPEAREAVAKLRRAGISHVALLTGDNPRTAEAIARQIGVDSCHAGLLPADKVGVVKRLRDEYGSIAMVGDGVNDAPALATADVGVAMGVAGTDAALEVADVALMSDDLSRLDYAALLSREAVRVVKQNITVSLAVKAFALALAAFGTLPLWGAILADMGVSLLVTLNGMRLLGWGVSRKA
jgi:Cd2+/Zn2+-exporting ATPase